MPYTYEVIATVGDIEVEKVTPGFLEANIANASSEYRVDGEKFESAQEAIQAATEKADL